jgi:hypothetical protein
MDEVLNRLRVAAKQSLDELQRWHSDDRQTDKLQVIADYMVALEGGPVRELPDPNVDTVLPPNDGNIQIGGMMSTRNAFDSDMEPKALPDDTFTDFSASDEEFENSPGALDEVIDDEPETPKPSKRKAKG